MYPRAWRRFCFCLGLWYALGMSKSFTPNTHVIVTRGKYDEYPTESAALTALDSLTVWGVLMRVTAEGKPVAILTKGVEPLTALALMQKYR